MKSRTRRLIKFVIVGIINTAINLAVLNLLIFLTDRGRSGTWYAIYQGIGFLAASVNSYFMNKYWTFDEGHKERSAKEYLMFLCVSIIGLLLNTGSATLVVNALHGYFAIGSLEEKLLPSAGALVGTLISWLWNYNGYKQIFKERM